MAKWMTGAALIVAAAGLAGCVEDMGPVEPDNITLPQGMRQNCLNQASRMTGYGVNDIRVLSHIQTGGGPLMTMDVMGQKLSCRREANGRVTVFSEYAN